MDTSEIRSERFGTSCSPDSESPSVSEQKSRNYAREASNLNLLIDVPYPLRFTALYTLPISIVNVSSCGKTKGLLEAALT